MDERSLVIPENGVVKLPALLGGGGKAGVNVRPSRVGMRLPQLSLVHKVETREDIDKGFRPGDYRYGKDTPLSMPRVIFLRLDEVRQWDEFDRGGSDKRIVKCASVDARVPAPKVENPPAADCDTCPHSQWKTDKTRTGRGGKFARVPPACSPGFAFLGLIPELGMAPFWWTFFNTQEKAAANFVRDFLNHPTAMAPHELVCRLTSEQTTNTAGAKWYLPIITVEELIEPHYFGQAAALATEMPWDPYVTRSGEDGEEVTPGEEPPDQGAPMPSDDDIPF